MDVRCFLPDDDDDDDPAPVADAEAGLWRGLRFAFLFELLLGALCGAVIVGSYVLGWIWAMGGVR